MNSVLGKIDEDQRDVNQKSVENEELQLKLEQFQQHLIQRRLRLENLKQAKLLEARLEEAKRAQRLSRRQQGKQMAAASAARVRHLQETVHQLAEQQKLFLTRFAEFETTLKKSDEVIKQLQVACCPSC